MLLICQGACTAHPMNESLEPAGTTEEAAENRQRLDKSDLPTYKSVQMQPPPSPPATVRPEDHILYKAEAGTNGLR